MYEINRQRGLTFVGLMFLIVFGGGIVLIGLKVIPIYIESFKIDQALAGVLNEPNVEDKSPRDIRKLFIRRMDVEDVDRFNSADINKVLKVDKKNGGVSLSLEYQAVTPLFSNLSLVADWKKEASK